MKPTNLISAYQSTIAINNSKLKFKKKQLLKLCEANVLAELCENLLKQGVKSFDIFDGYFVAFTIKQISKEFDLLRFSDDYIINIELKSELDRDKIKKQMEQNYYYLKFIGKKILIYTYVSNGHLFSFDTDNQEIINADFSDLISSLSSQAVNYNLDPEKIFIPSKYLVSPFNNTDRFLRNEYFLNDAQQNIKKDILKSLSNHQYDCYCISANAGTGKTLLMYDIAKTIKNEGKKPLIIHCGKLNEGQNNLINTHHWNIISIGSIEDESISSIISKNTDAIFVDESQRISDRQLELILEKAKELNILAIFAYDTKQYLRDGESKDIYEYLKQYHDDLTIDKKILTTKVRTNKDMTSFIVNLFEIGKSNSYLNYENITIDYFTELEYVHPYIKFLSENQGWKAITYTPSAFKRECISKIASICEVKAHNVIGQEFDKVVFIMDRNFQYKENKLIANPTYYSMLGMLYQIATRAINELKIIVVDNPELYYNLLEIKSLGEQDR